MNKEDDEQGVKEDHEEKLNEGEKAECGSEEVEKSEAVKPQPQMKGGKKGKKKQKWKKVDLSTLPDTPAHPSVQTANIRSGGANAWRDTTSPVLNNDQTAPQYGSHQTQSGYQAGASRHNQPQDSNYSYQRKYQAEDFQSNHGDEVALSKALARLLRHRKPKEIDIDDEGYARIDQILQHHSFRRFNTSAKGINKLVNENSKKRFEIAEDADKNLKIRATQGHSFKIKDLGLVPITDPNKHQTVVHGTYSENWRTIKKEGLKTRGRTHVHFAIGNIGETHVTSGMRYSCDITIYLDMKKAMEGGLMFFESSNGVVLCEGDKFGVISPKYFAQVKKWNEKQNCFLPIPFEFTD